MPNDWRRFTGPDVSVPYSTYLPAAKNTGEQLSAILFPAHLDGKRADGRELSQSRPFSVLRTGVVSQAKGSAYIELGHTKVICSVFAPREIPNKNEFSGKGQLYCEVKYAMFACARRRPHAPEADERELSAALRRALEPPVFMNQFPNYQIDVMVQILQNDGGCLAAAITAAGLALADAGIPMMDLICACTLAVLDDRIFVDPTEAEENACLNKIGEEVRNHGVLTVAVTAEYERICHTVLIGSMDAECVSKCLDLLLVKCTETLLPEVQSVLMTSTEKAVEEKNKALELSKDKDEFLRKTVRDFKEKFNL